MFYQHYTFMFWFDVEFDYSILRSKQIINIKGLRIRYIGHLDPDQGQVFKNHGSIFFVMKNGSWWKSICERIHKIKWTSEYLHLLKSWSLAPVNISGWPMNYHIIFIWLPQRCIVMIILSLTIYTIWIERSLLWSIFYSSVIWFEIFTSFMAEVSMFYKLGEIHAS